MKFCPTCQTRYDEEILRFCIKDGTPLVEENQPTFTELPSESVEEETVIRPNRADVFPAPKTTEETAFEPAEKTSSPRIVIPTAPDVREPQVRTKTTESYRRQPLPKQSNTTKIVVLTILGTLIILAGAGIIFMFLSNSNNNQNISVNANLNPLDANLNTNLDINNSLFNAAANLDANLDTNFNTDFNLNSNVNLKTPTPTPKPTPSPTATPTPSPETNVNSSANLNANVNASETPRPSPNANSNLRPTPLPTTPPTPQLTPIPSALPTNRPVNAGILNGRAINLPKPAYPPAARQMGASGQVAVQVIIDEGGNVLSARATNGNPLLRQSAEAAARQSRINPVKVGNQPVQAVGILLYNFVNE